MIVTRTTASTDVPGAVPVAARSLAPDLARGAMLLFIALANAPGYLYGHPMGVRGYRIPQTLPERLVIALQMTLVDGRAYPMFALLFGYGMVQMLRRHTASGVDAAAVRRLIRRRGRWLVLIGLGHAALLFSGDILGSYGLLAVLLAGVLTRVGDRTLLAAAALWLVPVAVLGALFDPAVPDHGTAATTAAPLVAAWERVGEWGHGLVLNSLVNLVPPLLVGVWAARRRLLDDPARHRRLLVRAGVVGCGSAVAGGIPLALMGAFWWPAPSATAVDLAAVAHTVGGYCGGVGYAALAGLVAIRVDRRRGRVVTALAACGQRSMTSYLLQSVVFVAVLAEYGGGLGDALSVAQTALLAVGTWAATVVLADRMRSLGHRGPAEMLLRRLTYGRRDAAPHSDHPRSPAGVTGPDDAEGARP